MMQKMFVIFLLAAHLCAETRVANVTNIHGTAQASMSTAKGRALALGSPIYEKDTIEVAADSALQMEFLDSSILELGANTKYLVKTFMYNKASPQDKSESHLFYGGMRLLSGNIPTNPGQYNIETENATLGLLGTYMEANYADAVLSVACSKGHVQIKNEAGTIVIGQGMEEYAIVTAYNRTPRIFINPPPIFIRPTITPK